MQNIKLRSIENPSLVYTTSTNSSSGIIGRGESAEIFIPEAGISREHAQISKYGSNYYIKDLGSTNGSFINGQQLEAGLVYPIRPKDILRIGTLSYSTEGINAVLGDPSLSAFGEDLYQGEFFIGSSTSFSYGGSSATIPSASLGTDDLIFLVRREGSDLIISQKSREFTASVNGVNVEGRMVLSDLDRISIGNLTLFVSLPSFEDLSNDEALKLQSSSELPSYLKDRIGEDAWKGSSKRSRNTGTLLAIEKVIEEESRELNTSTRPEQGIHRFSTATLRIAEANVKKDKIEFFLGVFSIVATIFMAGVLLYLY